MKKWYAAVLLAAFALLVPIMGTGQSVYATGNGGVQADYLKANFWFEDEIRLLPGWTYDFRESDSGDWNIENDKYGGSFPMIITDVSPTTPGENKITVEEESGLWRLRVPDGNDSWEDFDETFTVSYTIDKEALKTEEAALTGAGLSVESIVAEAAGTKEVTVCACQEVYSLEIQNDGESNCLFPGDGAWLWANIYWDRWSADEGHYSGDTDDVTFAWSAKTEEGTSIEGEESGNSFSFIAPDNQDGYRIYITVQAKVGSDVVASGDYELYVTKEYYVLRSDDVETYDVWAGESVTLKPEVWLLNQDWGGERDVTKNVDEYRLDYNNENFEVNYNEADGTITIKRLSNFDDRVRVEAVIDGNVCCDREWRFYWMDYNVQIDGAQSDSDSWLFVDEEDPSGNGNEDGVFTLNIDQIRGDYIVEWEIQAEQEENGWIVLEDTSAYEVNGKDPKSITIHAAELKKMLEPQYLYFQLHGIVRVAEEEVGRATLWIDIREPQYELEDQDIDNVPQGASFIYDSGKIKCKISNKDYPQGKRFNLEIKSLKTEDEWSAGDSEEDQKPVWEIKTDEDGTITAKAVNCGSAMFVYTVVMPDGKEKEFRFDRNVSPEIYWLELGTDTGDASISMDEKLQLVMDVYRLSYTEEGSKTEKMNPEEYVVRYSYGNENNSNVLSVDADGKITPLGAGSERIYVEIRRKQEGSGSEEENPGNEEGNPDDEEGEYLCSGEIEITVLDEGSVQYRISAEDICVGPEESVDAIDLKWKRYDAQNPRGKEIEVKEVSYRISKSSGIQLNKERTGFTVESDVWDGEDIEIYLNADGNYVNEDGKEEYIWADCTFILTVCYHDFQQGKVVPATCTEKGSETLECTKCHKTTTQEIPATGHTAGEWTTTKQPTATEAGTQEQKCTVCGTVLGTKELPATGTPSTGEPTTETPSTDGQHQHTAGEWTTTKQPTCTEAGLQEQKCTECGAVMNTKELPATGHSYGEWTETKKATVLKEGTRSRTCTVCGNTETENTAKAKAVIKLNVKSIPLQVKKSTTAVKVTSMGEGDSVKSWKSSNAKIASVNKKGKITGKKVGTAKITVTLKSGVSAKVTVKVQKKAVTTKKLSVTGKSVKKNKVTLKKGKSVTLTVTKNPITSTDRVTYKSSNKKIATVSSKGKITAKKAGKAKITVQAGKKKTVITVTVKK